MSTWVLVHEYEYKYEYYDFGTHEYEYNKSTRNSVLEYCEYEYRVRVPQPWIAAWALAVKLLSGEWMPLNFTNESQRSFR